MNVNWKYFIGFLLLGIFLTYLVWILIPPVSAGIQRPLQGDMVEVKSMIDLTGVMGWAEKMAYYGYSGDLESDPMYILDLPDTKKGYYQFYIDPEIFGQRLGPWFQYYGNNTGTEHGNLLMFRVVQKLPEVNVTPATPTPEPTPTPKPSIVLPKAFETDFQIAYGDPFSVTVNDKYMPARLWVFGRQDKVYNKSFPKSVVTLSPEEVQNLEPGTYTVIVQNPGKNAIFEVGYTRTVTDSTTTEELTSPWAAVKPVDIYGIQPRMALVEFRKMIAGTDDPITEYRLEIADPVIDMVSIDETYSEGKDVLDIRGYTNVAEGTEITFVMDKDWQTPRTIRANTFMEIVRQDVPNEWRYFQIFIPIDYSQIPIGQHMISASTPQGATQSIPFYVYDLPAGQVTPNETIKYVAGNIFVPTPTPEIIKVVETVIQTQIVTVPVTPATEVVYAQQKKASDENFWFWITNGIIVFVILVIGYFSGRYILRVIKRARLR